MEKDGLPFYVKLRAEAQESLVNSGSGQLYLGFFLDPLYKVHWNNKAEPIRYQITAPDSVTVTPSEGQGPDVDADADADPREFLVDVVAQNTSRTDRRPVLQLTVQYFACDDADTFCVPVKQQYAIQLQVDPDGGWRSAARSGSAGRFGARPSPRAGGDAAMMVNRLMQQRDANDDGQISRSEAPQPLLRMFDSLDANNDGQLQRSELSAMSRQRARSRAGR